MPAPVLEVGPKRFRLDRTLVMGVLNVTPDSFSDGGEFQSPGTAIKRAMQMVEEGADIVDIGGESTRPHAHTVPVSEEIERILPVLEGLRGSGIPISVDTRKPEVAERALEAGAHMVNDVNGLRDHGMVRLVAEKGVPVVVMHMKGEPGTMQDEPSYGDVVLEIRDFLGSAVKRARAGGIREERIIVDPGLGFGKTAEHNLEILRRLGELKALGRPILVGASRKSFIGKVLGLEVRDRLEGSLAALSIAILNGARIVRVHDVRESVRAARLADAVVRGVRQVGAPTDNAK